MKKRLNIPPECSEKSLRPLSGDPWSPDLQREEGNLAKSRNSRGSIFSIFLGALELLGGTTFSS